MILDQIRALIEAEYAPKDIIVTGTRYKKKIDYDMGPISIETWYDSDKDPSVKIYYKGTEEWTEAWGVQGRTISEKKEILDEIFDNIAEQLDRIYTDYGDEIEADGQLEDREKEKLLRESMPQEIIETSSVISPDMNSVMTAYPNLPLRMKHMNVF